MIGSMTTRELDKRKAEFDVLMSRLGRAMSQLAREFYLATLAVKMLKGDDEGKPIRPCHLIGVKVERVKESASEFRCESSDPQVEVTGLGMSEAEAMRDFDENWCEMMKTAIL